MWSSPKQGSLPAQVDSEAGVVLTTRSGVWTDWLTPDHKRKIRLGYHSGKPGVSRFLNVHLDVPVGREVSVQIVDRSGREVGRTTTNEGHGVATIIAQRDEYYWIRLNAEDAQGPLKYTVYVKPATRVTKSLQSAFAIGGVDVQKDAVYVAAGEVLEVYTVQDGELILSATLDLGFARDVFVDKDHAYVAAGDRGLVVVDVSNPTSPFEVASAASVGYAKRLAAHKDELFVSVGQFGVAVYDIADPADPVWIETLDAGDTVEDVAIGRHMLAVATLSGEVKLYGLKKKSRFELLATITASDWIQDIRFRGGHLLVLLVGGQVEEWVVNNLSKIHKVGTFDETDMMVSGSIDGDTQATLDEALWLPSEVELSSFVDAEEQ